MKTRVRKPEVWLDIDGFSDYMVSNLGRVKSYKQQGLGPGLILKQQLKTDQRGEYFRVSLVDDTGRARNRRVHRLVLLAFVGPPPSEKHVGGHHDGNSRNNWLDNLRWVTPKENEADKQWHGTKLLGSKVPGAKLTPAIVRKLRKVKKWSEPLKQKFMADLGVSRNAINDVLSRRTWSWLK